MEGAPDLVVEIVSPSTLKRDKIDKLQTYAFYKVPEYWIIEPKAGILEQFILMGDQYQLLNIFQGSEIVQSTNIPCISFTMGEVMEKIPEKLW
jgi:Uma2 family endonuclease